MLSPLSQLDRLVSDAIQATFGQAPGQVDAALRPSRFADAQANAALALAKSLGQSPRETGSQLLAGLTESNIQRIAEVELSGPGFLNFTFHTEWLAEQFSMLESDPRLGVPTQNAKVIPIDYSAPNVAKEMHVGHLRTTVVGDSLARILEVLGHHVIRQNHIGDWGTPFGMLIEHLIDVGTGSAEARLLESDPNTFYQSARSKFDSDSSFAQRSRFRVVRLQAHEPESLEIWQTLVERSKQYFNEIYARLNISLKDADLAGESTYNDDLAAVCEELEASGIARVSNGALCVFLNGYSGRDGEPSPLIIRKSDGGYGYATTDLATVRKRVDQLAADRLLYVVGATQELHLRMVWETARLAGWLPERVQAEHIQIGSVLGPDHKILRTRSGESVRLRALLDEATARVADGMKDRPELAVQEREEISEKVGIGAVKYADLSVAHDTDYVFDVKRMTATTGNTGPYLQYAATRIQSILRSTGDESGQRYTFAITNDSERALVLSLLGFGSVVAEAGTDAKPHLLCAHLFILAQEFSRFYETSPILSAEGAVRWSRVRLAEVTLAVITRGLDLLGIELPTRM
ncbi:arginine--tRNA ligase [Rhodococcus sp. H29-C3]|uniref:arginine--tRNA ligase n=1 Tax=Rhodococcus sp. H29-C3 TaxID=3046307 RepID=UPI0024BB82D5|nr:arginine--tRNA ligase [Rhodococcus sp. H29-C3]MDJ0362308.1 arginine--tRNA ligase [Rhodococcus sp. H29-C3]